MPRVTVEDVRLYSSLVAAALPAGAQLAVLGVEAVAAVIKAVKKLRGEAVSEDGAEETLIAKEVVSMLTAAQDPWRRVRDVADAELAKLAQNR